MSISDAPQCSATAKSTGQRCRRAANRGFTVCQMHGGGSSRQGRPGGRPIVSGRYSKHLPERLGARYSEALADTKLLELRDEIALIDARLAELLGRIDTGEAGSRWRSAQLAHAAVQAAVRRQDAPALQAALTALSSALAAGVTDSEVWGEIYPLIDGRRRLVESEHKRLVSMQQMITVERAMILLAAITSIIKENVSDATTLAAISTGISQLISIEPSAES